VAFAAGGIIAKNIAGEVNQVKKAEYIDSDKSSFMPLPIESSGNSAIDLLNILQYFHSLEIFFVLCLGFYFIIMKLDWDKTNILIEKYIPLKAQKFLIWYIKSLKLSVNFLFISFWVLLFLALLISSYYFDFLVDNMDTICKIYKDSVPKK